MNNSFSNQKGGLYAAYIIINSVPNLIDSVHVYEELGQIHILTSRSKINKLLYFIKSHTLLQFKSLQDIYALDLLEYDASPFELNKEQRFQVDYLLLSVYNQLRILIKVNISNNSYIDSSSNIYNSAVWLEREIWDLFGLYFKNHPDLRRILTDYGFEGHPLRKDFPLSGFTEILYTTEEKKISVKPLELTQEYRGFNFISPWDIRK